MPSNRHDPAQLFADERVDCGSQAGRMAFSTCSSEFVRLLRCLAEQHETELQQVEHCQAGVRSWLEEELSSHRQGWASSGKVGLALLEEMSRQHTALCAGLALRLEPAHGTLITSIPSQPQALGNGVSGRASGSSSPVLPSCFSNGSADVSGRAVGSSSPFLPSCFSNGSADVSGRAVRSSSPLPTCFSNGGGSVSSESTVTQVTMPDSLPAPGMVPDPPQTERFMPRPNETSLPPPPIGDPGTLLAIQPQEGGTHHILEKQNTQTTSVSDARRRPSVKKKEAPNMLVKLVKQDEPDQDEEEEDVDDLTPMRRVQRRLKIMVCSDQFEVLLAVIITCNTVLMALEMQISGSDDGQKLGYETAFRKKDFDMFFEMMEWLFGAIFTCEAFTKVVALDFGFFVEPAETEDIPPQIQNGVPLYLYCTGLEKTSTCAGLYELNPLRMANGCHVWKKTGQDRWIYNGGDGRWRVDNMADGSHSIENIVATTVDSLTLPHEYTAGWLVNPGGQVNSKVKIEADSIGARLCWRWFMVVADLLSRIDYWNILDLMIVAFWFVSIASDAQLPIDPMLLRLVRLARLLRLLRLVRTIQGFDSLYLMTTTIKGSFSALFWSALLIFVVQTMIAFVLHQLLKDYYNDESNDLEKRQDVFRYFGTFTKAMFSMFELTLSNWIPISRLIVEEVSEAFLFFVLSYKLIIGFSVIMVITGVFNQQTFKVAATDDHIMLTEKERDIKIHRQKMQNLMAVADSDGDGTIDLEEFVRICKIPALKKWLGCIGVPIDDAEKVYQVMVGGSGSLDADKLAANMQHLKGPARSVDLALMAYDTQKQLTLINQHLSSITTS